MIVLATTFFTDWSGDSVLLKEQCIFLILHNEYLISWIFSPLFLSSTFHLPSSWPQLHQEEVIRWQWAGKSHRWCILPWTLARCQLLPVQCMAQWHGCRYLLYLITSSLSEQTLLNFSTLLPASTLPKFWLFQLTSSLYTSVTYTCLCIHPTHPSILWIGTHTQSGYSEDACYYCVKEN